MMKALSYLLFFSLSILSWQCSSDPKQHKYADLPPEVSEAIEARIEKSKTPSLALAVIDQDGIRYYNFGTATFEGKEVNEHTIYEIGSISKVFTAILLAQQVLVGDVQLDDQINEYLPDSVTVPVMGTKEITFGHLTDHTSGLPRMPDNFNPENPNNPYADYSVQQMYTFISTYKPVREVGAEYEYSNLAQGLLGHLLAENKGLSYEELMITTIAEPLGMTETKITFNQSMLDSLARGHRGKRQVENWDIPTLAGAGAIRSSTFDMAKFISANLGYIDTPLKPAMDLSHQVRHDKAGDMRVAMGWHVKKGAEGDVIWHNGGTGGYRSFAGFVKETGKGVVVLTNSNDGSDDIGFRLLDSSAKLN